MYKAQGKLSEDKHVAIFHVVTARRVITQFAFLTAAFLSYKCVSALSAQSGFNAYIWRWSIMHIYEASI